MDLINFDSNDTIDGINDYFNPQFVCQLAEQYCTLQAFFIIDKIDYPFIPIDQIEDLFKMDITGKLSDSIIRLKNLLKLINRGIAQQSILSGNFMMKNIANILYGDNEDNYQPVIDIINGKIKESYPNETLQKNLAVFLINLKISDLNKFFDLYSSITNDPDKLKALNALLDLGGERLEFGYNTDNKTHPLLYLHILKYNKDKKPYERVAKLLLPD